MALFAEAPRVPRLKGANHIQENVSGLIPSRDVRGCLGPLDGTHVNVKACLSNKGRYRNRKGEITVNVLGVCNMGINFTYVLTCWEGSAANCRILCETIIRENGLRVPKVHNFIRTEMLVDPLEHMILELVAEQNVIDDYIDIVEASTQSSGFNWNDTAYVITADDDALWDKHIMVVVQVEEDVNVELKADVFGNVSFNAVNIESNVTTPTSIPNAIVSYDLTPLKDPPVKILTSTENITRKLQFP
ncbi:hypothetical protein BUALT_Bualt04G0056200 [Buddleja alternifolia]|uniref:DDE Tnp4 domain-containing protein n=1 Tax=Buddleja alternifolia TaxID=168488 RepID=A0AAV6XLL0_9LAMI|nr:hypothetical protein BUALT_Bualt04G0056200 [Buddleja alternifolia]